MRLQKIGVQVHAQAGPLGEMKLIAPEVERVIHEPVVVAVVGDVVLQPVQVRDGDDAGQDLQQPIALCGLIGVWYARGWRSAQFADAAVRPSGMM